MKKFAQIGDDGVAFNVVESSAKVEGDKIIEVVDSSVIGKKWDGSKFVEIVVPKRYKVWSAVAFVTICGKDIFKKIVTSTDEELQFFKYVLDRADVVDLNIPEYFAMVQRLNTTKIAGVPIMSDAIFQVLTAKE